jgi:hypothetical protein
VPIVFQFGVDPVAAGVVNSFNRPSGNVTGIVNLSVGLIAKRLELARQLVLKTKLIAVLLNPDDTAVTASEKNDIGNARATLGVQLEVLEASTIPGIETAFAKAVDIGAGALVISSDSLFIGAPALAMRYGVASSRSSQMRSSRLRGAYATTSRSLLPSRSGPRRSKIRPSFAWELWEATACNGLSEKIWQLR